MNIRTIAAAALVFAAFPAIASESGLEGLDIGEKAPAIEGAQWIGSNGRMPELKNKVVLVDFWYAACPTCIHAMPEISLLAEKYRKDGLVVVGPSLDAETTVRQFRELHGVSYPFLAGALSLARAYNVRSFPFLVLIGKNGRVLWRANFKDETLTAAIEAALRR